MKIIHRSHNRGRTKLKWLDSRHSFSFGDYHNPKRMNFGALRVLNEDWIEPEKGFPLHPHRNMEIITVLLSGSLEHQDNIGNKGIIKAGEVQHLSAGTGVMHAEYNSSTTEKVHLLQIWIEPRLRNVPPEYCQRKFAPEKNKLQTLVSGKRAKGQLFMQQDAIITRGIFDKEIQYDKPRNKRFFLFVINGRAKVNAESIQEGDSIETDENIILAPEKEIDILLIEV